MPVITIKEEDATDRETFAYFLSRFDEVCNGLFANLESDSFYEMERLLYMMTVNQPDIRPRVRLNLVGLQATGKTFLMDLFSLIRRQRALWMYGFNPDDEPATNQFPHPNYGSWLWTMEHRALIIIRSFELYSSGTSFSINEYVLEKTDVFYRRFLESTYQDVESFTILLDGKEHNMDQVNSFFQVFDRVKACTKFHFLRRRLALKRWSLIRQHFKDKFWVGGVLKYWAHETNKPGSKAYERVVEQHAPSFESKSKKQRVD